MLTQGVTPTLFCRLCLVPCLQSLPPNPELDMRAPCCTHSRPLAPFLRACHVRRVECVAGRRPVALPLESALCVCCAACSCDELPCQGLPVPACGWLVLLCFLPGCCYCCVPLLLLFACSCAIGRCWASVDFVTHTHSHFKRNGMMEGDQHRWAGREMVKQELAGKGGV